MIWSNVNRLIKQKSSDYDYTVITSIFRVIIALFFIMSGILKSINLPAVVQIVRNYYNLIGLIPDSSELSVIAFGICVFELFLGLLALDKEVYSLIWTIYIFTLAGFTVLSYLNLISR